MNHADAPQPALAAIEAEQSVLGALLLQPDALDRIDWLEAESFYREGHRLIYKALRRLIEHGKGCDMLLLAQALGGDLEKVGGLAYLGALAQNTPSAYNIARYAEIVRDKAILRALVAHGTEIAARAYEPMANPRELAEQAENAFLGILQPEQGAEAVSILECLDEALEWADNPIHGLPTGYAKLDAVIDGLRPEELIIIAGRPGMGKSSLALGIAEHVAVDQPAYFWSGEMSRRQLANRSLAYHRDNLGLAEATAHISRLKLHIDPRVPTSIAGLRMRLRRHKRKHGLGLLVVDYLQLIGGVRAENRNQEVGAISRGLKSLAKEFGIPVIALSSLSRKVEERTDRRPVMSDLRESGDIESDADIVIMVYRDKEYNPNTHWGDLAEIIVRKHREGATGTAVLDWRPQQTRFVDYFGDIPRATETAAPAPRPRRAKSEKHDGKMASAGPDA
ncbi:MAG: replicative DNA helicase [Betaproteobacteria bacterium]|nr:replicative DNA helicase [Betaproteobacteria bacterium]